MKTIDAYWDTRSLRKRTLEILVEQDDRISDVTRVLRGDRESEYLVVKTDPGAFELSQFLALEGFVFAECSLEVFLNLRNYKMPRLAQRYSKDISYRKADDISKGLIYQQIKKGIFNTDRIALDKRFGRHISADRYVNWIEDEIERGADLYHVFFQNDEEVGFFVIKESVPGVEANPFLAGLYDEYKSSGLGMNVVVGIEVEEALRRGLKRMRTHVSSNNVSMLNLYEYMGYHVSRIQNVYVKHTDDMDWSS